MNKIFWFFLFFSCLGFSSVLPVISSGDLEDIEVHEHTTTWLDQRKIKYDLLFAYANKKNVNLKKEIEDKLNFFHSVDLSILDSRKKKTADTEYINVLKFSLSRLLYDQNCYLRKEQEIKEYIKNAKLDSTTADEDIQYCKGIIVLLQNIRSEEAERESQLNVSIPLNELLKIKPKEAKNFELIDAIVETLPFKVKKSSCCMM